MKKLNVTPISDSAQMPLKKGTLQFLQDANLEVVAATMKALIGVLYNPDTVYVMFGCKNTGTDPNYIISAGAVFYQGEIFLVDAISFSTSGNTAIFQIITTQYGTFADPVTFTDSTVHNVHDIRKVQVIAGTTGTGIADYSQGSFLNFVIPEKVSLTGAGVTGTYPTFVIPGLSNSYPILYGGSFNVGDVSGGQSYSVTFPTVGTSEYYVQGSLISGATVPANDANVIWTIRDRTATGFSLYVRELSSSANNIIFEYTLVKKAA